MSQLIRSELLDRKKAEEAIAGFAKNQYGAFKKEKSGRGETLRNVFEGISVESARRIVVPEFVSFFCIEGIVEGTNQRKKGAVATALNWGGWGTVTTNRKLMVHFTDKASGTKCGLLASDNREKSTIWLRLVSPKIEETELSLKEAPLLAALGIEHEVDTSAADEGYKVTLSGLSGSISNDGSKSSAKELNFDVPRDQYGDFWESIATGLVVLRNCEVLKIKNERSTGYVDCDDQNVSLIASKWLQQLDGIEGFDSFRVAIHSRVSPLSWDERESRRLEGITDCPLMGTLKNCGDPISVFLASDPSGYRLLFSCPSTNIPDALLKNFELDH